MKTELLDKIFNCKWNVTSSKDEYIIGLFYKERGITFGEFNSLLHYVKGRKNSMGNEFNSYFSKELIELLEQAKDQLTEYDFKGYALERLEKNKNYVGKKNFLTLDEQDLLQYFERFNTGFRGKITEITRIKDSYIFETIKKNEISFYLSWADNIGFLSIEEAIIHHIFNGKYTQALQALLKASKY